MTLSNWSDGPRIGPNAVLQSLRAIQEAHGPQMEARIRSAARLPSAWPDGMIPEVWFVQLVETMRQRLGATMAEAALRQAGAYTADYVAEHRIPSAFKALLAALPARWSVPLLLFAFRQHAWTFAGSSPFRVQTIDAQRQEYHLILDEAPTCRRPCSAMGGAYYEAAFEGLLRLASSRIHVREVTCRRQGADACCFAVFSK